MAVISETGSYKKLQVLPFVIISGSFQKPESWRESADPDLLSLPGFLWQWHLIVFHTRKKTSYNKRF